jgi:DNA-binding FadR family transcriptional regulator
LARSEPPRNLHRQVVDELGLLIVGGGIAPGDPLPREETLAERMVVSRSALREAMKVLGAKGLIESRQKTGARVRETRYWNQLDADILAWRCAAMPTDAFVEQLLEMREIIEPAAAAAAAKKRDATQLARIAAAYAAMDAAADLDAWAAADLQFHEAVLAAANNELMSSLFGVIATALHTFFLLSARTAANFKYSLPHHFDAYDAIRRRRPEEANQAMQRMILESRRNMRRGQRKGDAA